VKPHLTFTVMFCSGLAFAGELPRSSPEAQGVSAAAIEQFVQAGDETIDSLHSFMLVRHGHVVAEGWWAPYGADTPHALFSLTKSFTSTAVGLAAAEGKLSLDDPILKFFPEKAPAQPGANLKSMRIRDLLRMSTGQQTEPPRPAGESWIAAFLQHPVPFKPGTHFMYNTSASCLLAAIVEKASGQSLRDYLQPRLFGPLGIREPLWEKSPDGVNIGGYGLSVRTEDIARFGLLYLQQGMWPGRRLLPEGWVEAATSLQTSNGSNPASDWDQGYGYQFWRCRHGCFRGDGAFGQYCIVLPAQDAVIAITSGVSDMQSVLNLVWDKLLPAMGPAPLAANPAADAELEQTLKHLSLRAQDGSAVPAPELGRTYRFAPNEQGLETVSLQASEPGVTVLKARIGGVDRRIECGRGQWHKCQAGWGPGAEPMAASGGWTAPDTFTARVCLYQTPFVYKLILKFSGDEVRYQRRANVGFGATSEAELVGSAH
jgi:CubicO group peptidase (beta-lactamase class C family)